MTNKLCFKMSLKLLFVWLANLAVFHVATAQDFRFANIYGSHMVLQRAPSRATVWGFANHAGPGEEVTVTVGETAGYKTATYQDNSGQIRFSVQLGAMEAGGPYDITAECLDQKITLEDVLFGDVWFCSGQSNMQMEMFKLDNPDPDIDDAVNYPNIRTFRNALRESTEPLDEVIYADQIWAVPTPDNVYGFSAVCWKYGTHLYDKLQIPIGLVASSWGGTRIEAWSSPQALQQCAGRSKRRHRRRRRWSQYAPNDPSALWNAMVHPFLATPITGAIWYQGEANQNNWAAYDCMQQAMIEDWRLTWYQRANEDMDPEFPFGFVQLAPWRRADQSPGTQFPLVRWTQTYRTGYVPNQELSRVFMAVSIDLPDFDSPWGNIHPRYKRQISWRLALGSFQVAYGITDEGRFQAPYPSSVTVAPDMNVIFVFMDGGEADIEIRGHDADIFEVCCSADEAQVCQEWRTADIQGVEIGVVSVSYPCDSHDDYRGLRYAWRESPCAQLEACPLYGVENSLPVPPFLWRAQCC